MGIVDGSFVSDISFRAAVVEPCREATDLPFEAHLMVTDPERLVPSMIESGCQMVIVYARPTTFSPTWQRAEDRGLMPVSP